MNISNKFDKINQEGNLLALGRVSQAFPFFSLP